jgi:glutathione S-transferase
MLAVGAARVTAVCSVVLLMKFAVVNFRYGKKRGVAGIRAPEDSAFHSGVKQDFGVGKLAAADTAGADPRRLRAMEDEVRWRRMLMNDLENIPLALIMMWMAVVCRAPSNVHVAGVLIFTLARCLFSLFYALALQPWRSLSFATSTISMWLIAINGVYGALYKLT